MLEVEVVGVRIELPSNQPLVLLKETDGERHIPIWIGAPEASAIAFAQQGIKPPRPMTHDLLNDVVEALGRRIISVRLVTVQDTVFFAELVFDGGTTVSSRASDAIAVALRAMPHLLRGRGDGGGGGQDRRSFRRAMNPAAAQDNAEGQLRQFREFLADVEPEDFET